MAATLNSGNMVVLGTETWGNARIDVTPLVKPEQALELGFAFADGRGPDDMVEREPRLEIIPYAPSRYQAGEGFAGPVGKGYGHLLVWTFVFQPAPRSGAVGSHGGRAQTGEVLAFQDINHYVEAADHGRRLSPHQHGHLPHPRHLRHHADRLADAVRQHRARGAQQLHEQRRHLRLHERHRDHHPHRPVRADRRTPAARSATAPARADISLGGTNGQHDCTTGGGSAGNTPASRSGFYELNKLKEQARGWLPSNAWLQAQLTANMNINQTCNAFWNGVDGQLLPLRAAAAGTPARSPRSSTTSGATASTTTTPRAPSATPARATRTSPPSTACRPPAWATGSSRPRRGSCGQTADGTGFNANENQTGRVRTATSTARACATPTGTCTPTTLPIPPSASSAARAARAAAPAAVRSTARPRPPGRPPGTSWPATCAAAPFNLDSQSAFIVGNRLFYQGSGNIGAWHACTCGSSSSGCGATNGYMQWLAADDDNGNLNDGTPHMTAICAPPSTVTASAAPRRPPQQQRLRGGTRDRARARGDARPIFRRRCPGTRSPAPPATG